MYDKDQRSELLSALFRRQASSPYISIGIHLLSVNWIITPWRQHVQQCQNYYLLRYKNPRFAACNGHLNDRDWTRYTARYWCMSLRLIHVCLCHVTGRWLRTLTCTCRRRNISGSCGFHTPTTVSPTTATALCRSVHGCAKHKFLNKKIGF